MGKSVKSSKNSRPPARTPEERENRLISLAVDLAEQQLRDGTASAQVISHFLKLGSTKEKLEKEMVETQIRNLNAKTEALETAKYIGEVYEKAIEAMKMYNGEVNEEDEESDIF